MINQKAAAQGWGDGVVTLIPADVRRQISCAPGRWSDFIEEDVPPKHRGEHVRGDWPEGDDASIAGRPEFAQLP